MGSGAAIVRNTRHPPLLNRCPKQQTDLAIPIIPASFALSALDDANSAVTQNYRQNWVFSSFSSLFAGRILLVSFVSRAGRK